MLTQRHMARLSLATLCLLPAMEVAGQQPQQPAALFAQIGLSAQQVESIDKGQPVAQVLSWGKASEVYVFGAVFINGSPDAYLKASRAVTRLAGTEGYLGIGEITPETTAADLKGLTLDPDDIKALKNCREGDCDVQLPTAAMQTFHDTVDWSQPDAAVRDQVNALARGMVLDLIAAYRRGGNAALGDYRDKQHPALVADQFATMMDRSASLPRVLPEVRAYLLDYPTATLPGADSFFYWEKVKFGLKPTVRVNHGIVYHGTDQNRAVSIVALKQLYASHYFHTALDVSICIEDTAHPAHRGFYLITLKGSEQEGLTGFKGSMLRKIVVDKTRDGLESALASIKRTVEGGKPRDPRVQ
jgi:hypothetical protein